MADEKNYKSRPSFMKFTMKMIVDLNIKKAVT